MGFLSALSLILIAGKIFGYLTVPWLIALSPVLIEVSLVILLVVGSWFVAKSSRHGL